MGYVFSLSHSLSGSLAVRLSRRVPVWVVFALAWVLSGNALLAQSQDFCDEVFTPYMGPTPPPNASSPPVPSVIEVPVAVHVITKEDGTTLENATGYVSKATIDQQISLFDAAFTSPNPSPSLPSYDFKMVALTYTQDDDWHTLNDGNPPANPNPEFVQVTNQISIDPSRVLNFNIVDYSARGRAS